MTDPVIAENQLVSREAFVSVFDSRNAQHRPQLRTMQSLTEPRKSSPEHEPPIFRAPTLSQRSLRKAKSGVLAIKAGLLHRLSRPSSEGPHHEAEAMDDEVAGNTLHEGPEGETNLETAKRDHIKSLPKPKPISGHSDASVPSVPRKVSFSKNSTMVRPVRPSKLQKPEQVAPVDEESTDPQFPGEISELRDHSSEAHSEAGSDATSAEIARKRSNTLSSTSDNSGSPVRNFEELPILILDGKKGIYSKNGSSYDLLMDREELREMSPEKLRNYRDALSIVFDDRNEMKERWKEFEEAFSLPDYDTPSLAGSEVDQPMEPMEETQKHTASVLQYESATMEDVRSRENNDETSKKEKSHLVLGLRFPNRPEGLEEINQWVREKRARGLEIELFPVSEDSIVWEGELMPSVRSMSELCDRDRENHAYRGNEAVLDHSGMARAEGESFETANKARWNREAPAAHMTSMRPEQGQDPVAASNYSRSLPASTQAAFLEKVRFSEASQFPIGKVFRPVDHGPWTYGDGYDEKSSSISKSNDDDISGHSSTPTQPIPISATHWSLLDSRFDEETASKATGTDESSIADENMSAYDQNLEISARQEDDSFLNEDVHAGFSLNSEHQHTRSPHANEKSSESPVGGFSREVFLKPKRTEKEILSEQDQSKH
ncbi:hypothetical protein N7539_005083 [Penicillium diatomitis]|uniref:Uncharacterized protein n=1 Tax=Penicillium diatomitis TaxID=2819901 RepID=A0A9W9X7H2_9EURO|nr:uncharacterized protein N7539_005083 [Penicillium diatomitis]KAJ5485095.1 hypothetical protein N7539_005083 [Penicillium diatomitis]